MINSHERPKVKYGRRKNSHMRPRSHPESLRFNNDASSLKPFDSDENLLNPPTPALTENLSDKEDSEMDTQKDDFVDIFEFEDDPAETPPKFNKTIRSISFKSRRISTSPDSFKSNYKRTSPRTDHEKSKRKKLLRDTADIEIGSTPKKSTKLKVNNASITPNKKTNPIIPPKDAVQQKRILISKSSPKKQTSIKNNYKTPQRSKSGPTPRSSPSILNSTIKNHLKTPISKSLSQSKTHPRTDTILKAHLESLDLTVSDGIETPIKRNSSTKFASSKTPKSSSAWDLLNSAMEDVSTKPLKKKKLIESLTNSTSEDLSFDEVDLNVPIIPTTPEIIRATNSYSNSELDTHISDKKDNLDSSDESVVKVQSNTRTSVQRKTYGYQRSFINELTLQKDLNTDKEETDDSDEGEISFNHDELPKRNPLTLQSILSLKESGKNTRYSDELQYILDGINETLSQKRSSMIELATQVLDPNFLEFLRVQGLPESLFGKIAKEMDPLCVFLFLFISIRILEDSCNFFAESILKSKTAMEIVLSSVTDIEDIQISILSSKPSPSKNSQTMLDELLKKMKNLFSKKENSKSMFSKSFFALTVLLSLQNLEEAKSVTNYAFSFESQEVLHPIILSVESMVLNFDFDFDSEIPNKENFNDTLWQSLHMALVFIEKSISFSSSKILNVFNRENIMKSLFKIFSLIHFLLKANIEDTEDKYISSVIGCFTTFIKINILLTTYISILRQGKNTEIYKNLYDLDFIPLLLQLIEKANILQKIEKANYHNKRLWNLSLFTLGYLTNLAEYESCQEKFLEDENEKSLKKLLRSVSSAMLIKRTSLSQSSNDPSQNIDDGRLHASGYLCLLVGTLLISDPIGYKDEVIFKESDYAKVLLGLRAFREIIEGGDIGVKDQVNNVLRKLELEQTHS